MASDVATGTVRLPRWQWRFPATVAVIVVLVSGVLWLLPRDVIDVGMKRMISIIAVAIGLASILLWFVAFSKFSATTRLLTLLVALAAVGIAVGSVRRVEFTGDMRPIFDWRWTTDRNVALEQHRAAQSARDREALPAIVLGPDDVLEYRGAHRDGVVVGPALLPDWSKETPKLVWRQPVGGGYAAFVLAGPLAITIEQRRDREAIVAYDANTASEAWIHDYPALFSETLGGDGPRATPTIVGDRVYALGATGLLSCLDLASGQPIWTTNVLEANKCGNLDWGMAGSPLVFDGQVVVNAGTQGGTDQSRAILAFDAETGSKLWGAGTGKAGYTSPMLVTLAGKRQVLSFEGTALVGYDADQGEELWRVAWKSDFDINAAQPIVLDGDRLFITSSNGCALVTIAEQDGGLTATQVWKNRNLKGYYVCPVAYEGHAYGMDEGILVCINLSDGKRSWKKGRFGNGQLLLCGDLLVILSEQGELVLVKATPTEYTELGRIAAIEGRTWNNPAMRDGRIFVRNHLEMAAYDLPIAPPSESDEE